MSEIHDHVTGEVIETPPQLVRLQPAAIVMPAVSVQEALDAWKSYNELKKAIITADDVQNFGGKDFLKKSYWRKVATFFNLSLEVVKEEEIENYDGVLIFDVTYKATAPNGRTSIGDGSCESNEKGRTNSRHNTRSTAHTRAFNRAVSNLVGGGEVSAEEADQENQEETSPAYKGNYTKPGKTAVPNKPNKIDNPGNYVPRFGKYKESNTKLSDIPLTELEGYFAWLRNSAKGELSSAAEEFIEAANQFYTKDSE